MKLEEYGKYVSRKPTFGLRQYLNCWQICRELNIKMSVRNKRDKSIDCFFVCLMFDNMDGTAASAFDVFSAERIYLKQPFDL